MSEKLHKTVLRLQIDKTIQPKQYEPIKVQVSIEEDFYWETEEDRDKKMKKHRDKMLKDFVVSFNEAVVAIGEKSRCIGRISTNGVVPSNENVDKKTKETKETELEWEFD
jgi:hypothetical protein